MQINICTKLAVFLICSLIITSSCSDKDDDIPVPAPPVVDSSDFVKEELNEIWKHKIYSESESYLSFGGHTELFDQGIIVWKEGINNTTDTLVLLDKITGESIWKWYDYIRPGVQEAGSYYDYAHEGIYCYDSAEDNYGIDLNTGTTIWSVDIENLKTFITGNEDGLVFKTQKLKEPEVRSSIFVGDYRDGNFIEKVRILAEDGYNLAGIPNVSSFKNDMNETILVFFFQQEGWFNGQYKARVDYFAYNLNKENVEWRRDSLNPTGKANKTPPVIDETGIYVGGDGRVYKLNRDNGTTIWEREMPWGFSFDNYTQHNEKLIFNLGNGDLMAISKEDGNTIWINESLSGCCATPIIYDGKIFFANGSLHIVDVQDGNELYRIDPSSGSFLRNPAIDIENRKMYGTDGVYYYCWELP